MEINNSIFLNLIEYQKLIRKESSLNELCKSKFNYNIYIYSY